MAKTASTPLAVDRLASQIESDIRSRGLSPGDRYLTAKEAAKLLGVSPATCHHAMRLLADRDVLRRRRNSGTYVGQSLDPQPATLVRSVYILLSQDRQLGALSRDAVMEGLWRELPGVGLHFAVLPAGNEVRYVEELLTGAITAGQLIGVVAVSCPRDVYSYLARQTIPVVVVGSVDAADEKLASIDGDERAAGRLLAGHMLKREYRRFAVLLGEVWRPGDNLFLEGVQESLDASGLAVGALRVRGLPNDARIFRQHLRSMLAEIVAPMALICQYSGFVQWLDELKAEEPQLNWALIGIAFHVDAEMQDHRSNRYPCTYQTVSALEMSAMVGKMVSRLSMGAELAQRHVLLPMALYEPERR